MLIKHLNVQLRIEKQTKPVLFSSPVKKLTNEAIKPKLKRSSHPIGHEIMHLYAVKQMDGQTLKNQFIPKISLKALFETGAWANVIPNQISNKIRHKKSRNYRNLMKHPFLVFKSARGQLITVYLEVPVSYKWENRVNEWLLVIKSARSIFAGNVFFKKRKKSDHKRT